MFTIKRYISYTASLTRLLTVGKLEITNRTFSRLMGIALPLSLVSGQNSYGTCQQAVCSPGPLHQRSTTAILDGSIDWFELQSTYVKSHQT